MKKFPNLAGHPGADEAIVTELLLAGLDAANIVRHEQTLQSEVPTHITAIFGRFELRRAGNYWVIQGNMPLKVAEVLYEDRYGRKVIRVGGDADNPPPTEPTYIKWLDSEGRLMIASAQFVRHPELLEQAKADPRYHIIDGHPTEYCGRPFIQTYHVDTLEGLKLFVEKVREYQLF